PKAMVRKSQGKSDAGSAQTRAERGARMRAMGLIGDNAVVDDMEPTPQSWETLNEEERRIAARNMEVYAAMIERMDWNVGQLRKHLKASGRDKNTIFLFISDNGPAGQVAEDYMVVPSVQERLKSANNAMGNRGGPTSYVFYGAHWASAGSAPFRLHKGFVTDGGTRVPAIISGAGIE